MVGTPVMGGGGERKARRRAVTVAATAITAAAVCGEAQTATEKRTKI